MSLTILLVDDSKAIRLIAKNALKVYDCRVLEAGDGQEGLNLVLREKPDLIFLDITMPIMDGVTLLGKLKEEPETADIPVIMLTAVKERDSILKIVKMGVSDYIEKPFTPDQLINSIKSTNLQLNGVDKYGTGKNKYSSG